MANPYKEIQVGERTIFSTKRNHEMCEKLTLTLNTRHPNFRTYLLAPSV